MEHIYLKLTEHQLHQYFDENSLASTLTEEDVSRLRGCPLVVARPYE